jgi:hypothetical protein
MMEAARTSETLVNFYQTTRRYNSKDSHLLTNRRENLKLMRGLYRRSFFFQAVFFLMSKAFRSLASTPSSRMQIYVDLRMTRASWGTDLPVFEDKNGNVTGSTNDDSLGIYAEMVVEHAFNSAVLQHTLEADMAAVLSRRHRSLCAGSHICLGASVNLLEVLDWELEGETRLHVVSVAV